MTPATPIIANYNHLLTTRPHDIGRVIISDLHLSTKEPALVQAFLAFLDDLLVLPNITEMYVLGDWFDTWVGDDAYLSLPTLQKQTHWLTPIINKLSELKKMGCQTLVMHGNRDFLIGQAFCDTFGGQLIAEPYFLKIGSLTYRLEHGDALCTDDVSYQRFRRVTRHKGVQWLFLKQPLAKRLSFAQKLRQHSKEDKANKSMTIMDVNQQAVTKALKKVDHLLHGHTHRPAIHDSNLLLKSKHTKKKANVQYRYVLGDWRVINHDSSRQRVEAVIAITTVFDGDNPNQDNQNTKNRSAQNRQQPNERLQLVNFSV